jgi:hypothetical protein
MQPVDMSRDGSSNGGGEGMIDVGQYLQAAFRHTTDCCDSDSDAEKQELRVWKRRKLIRQVASSVASAAQQLMDAYAKYRGGVNEMRNYPVPAALHAQFDLETLDDKSFFSYFRFEKHEVRSIIAALGLPEYIKSAERDKGSAVEVFCLMCIKWAFPTRFCLIIRTFGRSLPAMSRLIKTLRIHLYERFANSLRRPAPLSDAQCEKFAAAIQRKCGMPIVVGFIDGTVREICKPSVLQGPLYNGKDRIHALKYQAINTPDGTIRHLAGPYPGSRHDQFMLHDSGVLHQWIAKFPALAIGVKPVIYADAGYSICPGIQVPYHDAEINAEHAAYNNAMASVRISIEWEFGAILRNWASLRYKPHEQLLSNRKIGQIYFVAALLTNFGNCCRPNTTSQYFRCDAPSLDEYLRIIQPEHQL